jgi:penicillin amidase
VIRFVLSECYEADPAFNYRLERRREGPIWKLVSEQPQHLLDSRFPTWDALLLAAIDATIEQTRRSGDLGDRRWSEYNVIAYRHPLSSGIPYVGRWLDMPVVPLPGDLYTPRVQWDIAGASVRMVVSPGLEAEGIMQMPTGQSGHPLSPFYSNSHAAWVTGEPTPFLPGPPVHVLTLEPAP